jgi:hypothetical protein
MDLIAGEDERGSDFSIHQHFTVLEEGLVLA